MVTSEQLWETYQREQRITNRVRDLYQKHREQHGTTLRKICEHLECSTSCFYSHLNGTTPRNPERMTHLVMYLGGDPVEVLEDDNALKYLPAANDDVDHEYSLYYINEQKSEVDRLLKTLTHRQIAEIVIGAAPEMSGEHLSLIVRELIEVGWNQGSRPIDIPF